MFWNVEVESTDFEIEQHYRSVVETVASAKRALANAEQDGSLNDWNRALETSLKVSDFAGRELVRSRLRRHLLEASNVLAGVYNGQESVELGDWANGATEQTLGQRAAEFLTLHKSVWQ